MHNIENENNTLEKLLIRIKDTNARKQDFIAPTKELQFRTIELDDQPQSEIIIEGNGGEPTRFLKVNDLCFDQIAQKNGLDVRTARRLQSEYSREYDLLTNAIWQKENSKRMIRTYDDLNQGMNPSGTARAFLSDKFKTFDNSDLLESALPQLMDSDACWKIVNCAITQKKMYIRLKSEIITGAGANVNDIMAHGIGLSNSETGAGSISAFGINWTLACLNGMQTQNITRKSHITSARDGDTWNILTDETKQADNHSLKLQLRDIVSSYASRDTFDENLEKMRLASEDTINVEASEAVENLGKVLTLSKKETSNVLDGLLKTIGQAGYENDKPVNRATFVNAVTRVGNNAKADDVDFWQKLGGQVLNMKKTDWNRVAMAS
jgi:hypothetical protein